jgi:DNA-binding MarR family transcriptional regulator
VEHDDISRESLEYSEIIADVFVETLQKSAGKAISCGCEREEITPALVECLQYVYLHGASSVRQIAQGLEVSLSAVSQLVDRLVKKDLVTRCEKETDRRLTEVALTPNGREVVKEMRARKSELFESILNAMSEADRVKFRDGLEAFLKVALAGEENIEHACVRCGMEHVAFCVVNKVKIERSAINGSL